MTTERRAHPIRNDEHDEEWRHKIQRALRDLRELSPSFQKECVAG